LSNRPDYGDGIKTMRLFNDRIFQPRLTLNNDDGSSDNGGHDGVNNGGHDGVNNGGHDDYNMNI